jgi:hypothetical protein
VEKDSDEIQGEAGVNDKVHHSVAGGELKGRIKGVRYEWHDDKA